MFIAVTRITAPPEALDRMAGAFRQAAPDLKQFAGFLGFELWRDADSLQAVSRWQSREAMEGYAASGAFGAHHGGQSGAQSQGGQGGGGGGSVTYYDGEVVV
jgi:heme-degrading monooxygenase HmoA